MTLARVAGAAFPRFLLVGSIGFAVDLAAFLAARALLPDSAARLVALLIAVAATWWLNRRLTFRSADPNRLGEFLRYCATSALGAATNACVSLALLWQSQQFSPVFALAVGSLAALFVNFVLARSFAYRVPPSVPPPSSPYSPTKVEDTHRVSAGGR